MSDVVIIQPGFDHVTTTRADGTIEMRPAAASEDEKQRVEAETLRRELHGIAYRLEHLDDPPMHWQEPPSPESVARTRTSLENTREVILTRLGELEPDTATKPKRRRRR